MFKCVFFLFVAFACYQGSEAQPIESTFLGTTIADVIQFIKDTIAKAQATIQDLASKVDDIVEGLQERLRKAIKDIDLPGIMKKVESELQDIVTKAGVTAAAAKKCFDDERQPISDMLTTTNGKMFKCMDQMNKQSEDLQSKVTGLFTKSLGLLSDANKAVLQCVTSNIRDLSKAVACLTEQSAQIKQEAGELIDEVKKTFDLAQQTGTVILDSLKTCVADIKTDVQTSEATIVDNFTKCVQALPNA